MSDKKRDDPDIARLDERTKFHSRMLSGVVALFVSLLLLFVGAMLTYFLNQ